MRSGAGSGMGARAPLLPKPWRLRSPGLRVPGCAACVLIESKLRCIAAAAASDGALEGPGAEAVSECAGEVLPPASGSGSPAPSARASIAADASGTAGLAASVQPPSSPPVLGYARVPARVPDTPLTGGAGTGGAVEAAELLQGPAAHTPLAGAAAAAGGSRARAGGAERHACAPGWLVKTGSSTFTN